MRWWCTVVVAVVTLLSGAAMGEDPYLYFTWNVTYGTIAPLGVPQQGILINGLFPGPNINSTTNNNIVLNVINNLDEPLLFHWMGIQQRKNSWQDGVLGTNCPILPGTNYTYRFQVKDQIGSFFYYPSTALHRAAGGFGGLRINSRLLIPVPYADPEDDYTVLIGDWYTESHTTLRRFLDFGRSLGRPDGVLINGKGPARLDGKDKPAFTMKPGKTYKLRICNVGMKNSLNFRIQDHPLQLVEMEGSHTVQNTYESLDVHLGQCFSVLLTAKPHARDFLMVASTRFTKRVLTGRAVLRVSSSKAHSVSAPLPTDIPGPPAGWAWSLNQFRSFRWNLTASAARPNPQGSYHYGAINITRTIRLANAAGRVQGRLRYGVNGVSHTDPYTPPKLAEYYNITEKVFKYDLVKDEPPVASGALAVETSVVRQPFRNFVEIVFENTEKSIQSWHLDGHSFFAVAVEPGRWAPEKRSRYNLLDGVSRHTVQVFPKSWAAIMLTFDNAGMWNLRSEQTERRYLGQQLYVSVQSPARSLRDEYNLPDNALLCADVKNLPWPPPYSL